MRTSEDNDGDLVALQIVLFGLAIIGAGYLIWWLGVEKAHMFGLFFGVLICIIGLVVGAIANKDDFFMPPYD